MRQKLSQRAAGIRLADTRHTVARWAPGKVGPPASVEAISSALNLGPVPRDRGGKRNPACKAVLAGVRLGQALHRPARRLPDIQAFAGALRGAQASRGVLITMSRFSSDVRDYAERVNARLVLIDGPELAAIMIEHDCGVIVEESFVLKQVDENFFEEE